MPTSTRQIKRKAPSLSAADLYFSLADGANKVTQISDAAVFLAEQLECAAQLECDLPREMQDLESWMMAGVQTVGREYKAYLQARAGGEKRRYFSNKAHALYFLKCVAPTKLVDGAWLYGVLPNWQDARFLSLVQTYLEELGEGQTAKNHVVIYRKLLASQGISRWDDLDDEYYLQGALQLAMAHHADRFLPEIIGFNLGYEQLPLHLLITSYELKELGIDPYYFTLHITVDNADSGHAKAAVDSVFAAMPQSGADDFYRRVQNGYKLNLLGANTHEAIADFDIEREMSAIFQRKAAIGQHVHSNYRRIEGRTVNEWLSDPAQMPEFMAAMEKTGWLSRHQDPRKNRFWKMIQSEKANMYGVFSAYEQQVIYDWIAGDATGNFPSDAKIATLADRSLSPEDKQRFLHSHQTVTKPSTPGALSGSDFDNEERALEASLKSRGTHETIQTLIALMSPDKHHSAPGLAATRIFNELVT